MRFKLGAFSTICSTWWFQSVAKFKSAQGHKMTLLAQGWDRPFVMKYIGWLKVVLLINKMTITFIILSYEVNWFVPLRQCGGQHSQLHWECWDPDLQHLLQNHQLDNSATILQYWCILQQAEYSALLTDVLLVLWRSGWRFRDGQNNYMFSRLMRQDTCNAPASDSRRDNCKR